MKIGLDFDGVVANTPKLKSDFAKKMYGIEIDPYFFGSPYVTENGLLSKKDHLKLKFFLYNDASIIPHFEPVEGALTFINKLREDGHHVEIITARPGITARRANEWLKHHSINIELTGVGFIRSKARAARDLDVFVDDLLINLYNLVDTVPHRFIYSWGYNEIYRESGIATRIHTWKELYDHIKILSKR
jgi:hypothetical protein